MFNDINIYWIGLHHIVKFVLMEELQLSCLASFTVTTLLQLDYTKNNDTQTPIHKSCEHHKINAIKVYINPPNLYAI